LAPGRDIRVGLPRLSHRQIVGERHDAIERRVQALQPIEIHRGELDRRHLPRFDQVGQRRDRPERDVLEIRRPPHGVRRARPERSGRAIEPRAGHKRAEVQRRRDLVVDVHRAERAITIEALVDAGQHACLILVADVQPRHRERVAKHVARDATCALLLQLGPEDARQQRRRQAEAREAGDESSPGGVGALRSQRRHRAFRLALILSLSTSLRASRYGGPP